MTDPVVQPLVWSDSMVFGVRKYRGSSPFGEFESFGGNNLSDAHVEAMKADIERRYQEQVRAMLLPRFRENQIVAMARELDKHEWFATKPNASLVWATRIYNAVTPSPDAR